MAAVLVRCKPQKDNYEHHEMCDGDERMWNISRPVCGHLVEDISVIFIKKLFKLVHPAQQQFFSEIFFQSKSLGE